MKSRVRSTNSQAHSTNPQVRLTIQSFSFRKNPNFPSLFGQFRSSDVGFTAKQIQHITATLTQRFQHLRKKRTDLSLFQDSMFTKPPRLFHFAELIQFCFYGDKSTRSPLFRDNMHTYLHKSHFKYSPLNLYTNQFQRTVITLRYHS